MMKNKLVAPEIMEPFAPLRHWMRSKDCDRLYTEFQRKYHRNKNEISDWQCPQACFLTVSHVDVFYWLEPDIDTPCLSIIEDTKLPMTSGATTGNGFVYWGCTLVSTYRIGVSLL